MVPGSRSTSTARGTYLPPKIQEFRKYTYSPEHTAGLVVVDVQALPLELALALVGTVGLDAVLIRDHLPELGADLVAALARLDVDDFAHVAGRLETEVDDSCKQQNQFFTDS